MGSKINMNGLIVEQKGGKIYVNGQDVSTVQDANSKVSFSVAYFACVICLVVGFLFGVQF